MDILRAQLDAQRDQLADALERLKAQIDVLRAEELVAKAHKSRAMSEPQFRENSAKQGVIADVISAQGEVNVRDGMLQVKHAEVKAMQVQVDQVQRSSTRPRRSSKSFAIPNREWSTGKIPSGRGRRHDQARRPMLRLSSLSLVG